MICSLWQTIYLGIVHAGGGGYHSVRVVCMPLAISRQFLRPICSGMFIAKLNLLSHTARSNTFDKLQVGCRTAFTPARGAFCATLPHHRLQILLHFSDGTLYLLRLQAGWRTTSFTGAAPSAQRCAILAAWRTALALPCGAISTTCTTR